MNSTEQYVPVYCAVQGGLECDTVVFSLKTLERSARGKKSANTRGAERARASHAREVSLVYFTLALDLSLEDRAFPRTDAKIRLLCSLTVVLTFATVDEIQV